MVSGRGPYTVGAMTRETQDNTKEMVAFVAIAYALAIALSLVVGLTGGQKSPLIGLSYL
jgi:hypothetical protein